MLATIFCSSGACTDVLFGALPPSFVAADTGAYGCCGSAVSLNAVDVPAESVPSDSPRDCGDGLFMAGTFDSKWSGASLGVLQPSISDLPDWLAAAFGYVPTAEFEWIWRGASGLAPPGPLGSKRCAPADPRQAGVELSASTTRARLGVFLI